MMDNIKYSIYTSRPHAHEDLADNSFETKGLISNVLYCMATCT